MGIMTILSEEKLRLERLCAFASQNLYEISAIATKQKTVKASNGEERLVNYIDLDMFSPEQKQSFDLATEKYKEVSARLKVFDTYVKFFVPQQTIQSFNQTIYPSIDEYKNCKIPCSCIDLDENMQPTKTSIKVGPINVESPKEMTFDEYQQLYTQSLSNVLMSALSTLGTNYTSEQALQELGKICSEIYLNPPRLQKELSTVISK